MTSLDDRGRALENQHAREEEMAFRISARRNRLLGQWAATEMTLTREEGDAYATALVHADLEGGGEDDVVRKLVGDFAAAGLDHDEAIVRRALDEQTIEARRQLLGGSLMPMAADDIAAMIRDAIPDANVEITDLAGDGDHYAARVTSASFAGKSRVQQHKAVYEALGGRMGGVLHALQLTTAIA